MEKFNQLVNQEMAVLDQVIRQDLSSQVALINTIGEYIVAGGGKRIRPLVTLLCGKALNNHSGLLYKMAAMIEYIHTATLLHDDVVDASGLRRGRATANGVFGNAASVLVGDFIYTRAFQMMVESNSLVVLKIMADSTNVISEGEVLQLLNIGRSDVTEAEYFKVIESKTARLFEAAARVAAVISAADELTTQKLANYAIYLGTAFQIVDDILDYNSSAEAMGKNVGDDLVEGKVTLPLIYLLTHGDDLTKYIIMAAIDNPAEANLSQVVNLVKASQALTYCTTMAHDYVARAIGELNVLSASDYKAALITVAELSVARLS